MSWKLFCFVFWFASQREKSTSCHFGCWNQLYLPERMTDIPFIRVFDWMSENDSQQAETIVMPTSLRKIFSTSSYDVLFSVRRRTSRRCVILKIFCSFHNFKLRNREPRSVTYYMPAWISLESDLLANTQMYLITHWGTWQHTEVLDIIWSYLILHGVTW